MFAFNTQSPLPSLIWSQPYKDVYCVILGSGGKKTQCYTEQKKKCVWVWWAFVVRWGWFNSIEFLEVAVLFLPVRLVRMLWNECQSNSFRADAKLILKKREEKKFNWQEILRLFSVLFYDADLIFLCVSFGTFCLKQLLFSVIILSFQTSTGFSPRKRSNTIYIPHFTQQCTLIFCQSIPINLFFSSNKCQTVV